MANSGQISVNLKIKAIIILFIAGSVMYFPLIKYIVRYFTLNKDTGFLKELGFFSGPSGPWYAWIIAIIIALGYAYFTAMKLPIVKENWNKFSLLNFFGIYVALSASVIEEAFFRRFIIDHIFEDYSIILQILISGILFGLAHGIWGFLKGSLRIAWEAIKATTILGILLAVVYVLSMRSLAPCITTHFILTAIIEPWLLIGLIHSRRS